MVNIYLFNIFLAPVNLGFHAILPECILFSFSVYLLILKLRTLYYFISFHFFYLHLTFSGNIHFFAPCLLSPPIRVHEHCVLRKTWIPRHFKGSLKCLSIRCLCITWGQNVMIVLLLQFDPKRAGSEASWEYCFVHWGCCWCLGLKGRRAWRGLIDLLLSSGKTRRPWVTLVVSWVTRLWSESLIVWVEGRLGTSTHGFVCYFLAHGS